MSQRIALVGFGAIARSVVQYIQDEPRLKLTHIVVPEEVIESTRQALASTHADTKVLSHIPLEAERPDLVVECAGHSALQEHVLPALRAGVPCMVVSIGALSDANMAEAIEAAAREGNTQVQLLSGAIGGIDAVAAAKYSGLDAVTYVGRKPPLGWLGSPAEQVTDLRKLTTATRFFEGTAREAARDYPKNANVAATLSLAGIGLDNTRVELWADPAVDQNIHHYEASGAFGHMAVTLKGNPLPDNPKTSALTVLSIVRALKNRVNTIVI